MKKILLIFAGMFFMGSVISQTSNQTAIDEKSQMEVMVGKWTRAGIMTSDLFKSFYDTEYNAYKPEIAVLDNAKIAQAGKSISITIVMGSWCGDSQEQVPRFLKILDILSFPETSISIICVDRSKVSPTGETNDLGIILVPTIIIYNNGKELGRIIETPKETLEKDFLTIIK